MRCNQENEEEEKKGAGIPALLLDNICRQRQREAANDSNKYYFLPLLAPLVMPPQPSSLINIPPMLQPVGYYLLSLLKDILMPGPPLPHPSPGATHKMIREVA